MAKAPQPAVAGQVKPSMGQHQMPEKQMRQHLAQHVASANQTKDYGQGDIGENSHGGFTGSGASGGASGSAEYQTTLAGETGDADSGGPSGY